MQGWHARILEKNPFISFLATKFLNKSWGVFPPFNLPLGLKFNFSKLCRDQGKFQFDEKPYFEYIALYGLLTYHNAAIRFMNICTNILNILYLCNDLFLTSFEASEVLHILKSILKRRGAARQLTFRKLASDNLHMTVDNVSDGICQMCQLSGNLTNLS